MKQDPGSRIHFCGDCGEPVELYDANDTDSWIHAIESNYWGDHTAWVELPGGLQESSKNPALERETASKSSIEEQ